MENTHHFKLSMFMHVTVDSVGHENAEDQMKALMRQMVALAKNTATVLVENYDVDDECPSDCEDDEDYEEEENHA